MFGLPSYISLHCILIKFQIKFLFIFQVSDVAIFETESKRFSAVLFEVSSFQFLRLCYKEYWFLFKISESVTFCNITYGIYILINIHRQHWGMPYKVWHDRMKLLDNLEVLVRASYYDDRKWENRRKFVVENQYW